MVLRPAIHQQSPIKRIAALFTNELSKYLSDDDQRALSTYFWLNGEKQFLLHDELKKEALRYVESLSADGIWPGLFNLSEYT